MIATKSKPLKHTPNEWYAVRHEHKAAQPGGRDDCYRIDIRGDPIKNVFGNVLASEPICTLHAGFVHFEGNAVLILASPKLLAACQLFLKYDAENCQTGPTSYEEVKRAVTEAVAEAKGGAS